MASKLLILLSHFSPLQYGYTVYGILYTILPNCLLNCSDADTLCLKILDDSPLIKSNFYAYLSMNKSHPLFKPWLDVSSF